ncbi:MAG: hypothetical protein L0206_05700 [Actinobacteria bacterium]|nr:hypothetical protein [Actinomycetota bacterium]
MHPAPSHSPNIPPRGHLPSIILATSSAASAAASSLSCAYWSAVNAAEAWPIVRLTTSSRTPEESASSTKEWRAPWSGIAGTPAVSTSRLKGSTILRAPRRALA